MTPSTAPAAKAAIKALLTTALPSTTVTWGGPSESEDVTDEMVYMGSVRRTLDPKVLGAQHFEEEYSFPVIALGRLEGDNEQSAETRAWAMVESIEAAIRADLRLGGVLNHFALFGEQEVSTEPLNDGWLYRASVEIVCHART